MPSCLCTLELNKKNGQEFLTPDHSFSLFSSATNTFYSLDITRFEAPSLDPTDFERVLFLQYDQK